MSEPAKAFTKPELEAALFAMNSALGKSEKALLKLKAGTCQHTTTAEGIQAYKIAIVLMEKERDAAFAGAPWASPYTKHQLEEAHRAIGAAAARVEKVLPKFAAGTPQHTLALRRIRAFHIAGVLISRGLAG